MGLPTEIRELAERFERNKDAYRSPQYNETQLRREFLDPFFKALGWDIDNEQGYAEAYKDVIHEDAIKVGEATKAPDYCFRIGGARKFFLEAKKPAVDVKHDVSPAFQLRRYAWTTKLPLSILSDFLGVVGGFVISYLVLGLDAQQYWHSAYDKLSYDDIEMGLIKPALFGYVIATVGCYYGLSAKGGTQGVGRATTQAVVAASVLILAVDLFVTRFLMLVT